LPEVFSTEEVSRLLGCVTSLKYKAILSLMYSAGLRIGECTSLRPSDIDSKRMVVHVKNAKGKKDRYAILGKAALTLLRDYYKSYKPATWLFEGAVKGKQLHIRSIQKVFRRAVKDAGIKKPVTPHTLRHSFATHLLEQKCPLPAIQQFLGHTCIQSTLIYTHISPKALTDIVNPIDALAATKGSEAANA
jgi:site-specific recombinase XerD